MPTPEPAADNTGYKEGNLAIDAKNAQRLEMIRPGEYLCGKCGTRFTYKEEEGAAFECPKCHNTSANGLTAIYTEEDPKKDEMLGKNEFAAGD